MELVSIGISHKNSPIEIREKYFLNVHERLLLLSELKLEPLIAEAFVLSTCNRTEIYALMVKSDANMLIHHLSSIKDTLLTDTEKSYFRSFQGFEAVSHLLSVSAGLDSLVLGEKEILGQLKIAVDLARKKQMFGRFFNLLTNIAIRAGKKVRSETQIDCGGSSVSWAAVEAAKNILGTLENKIVLVIGAGKMSHLAANNFHRKGVGELFIMNRTIDKGNGLAKKFGGKSVGFWEIEHILEICDVCICSISAPHYIIEHELLEKVMEKRKQEIILIDISMPRNIHPDTANIEGVNLLSLDDLGNIVKVNAQQREKAVMKAEEIVTNQCHEFYKKINTDSTRTKNYSDKVLVIN